MKKFPAITVHKNGRYTNFIGPDIFEITLTLMFLVVVNLSHMSQSTTFIAR